MDRDAALAFLLESEGWDGDQLRRHVRVWSRTEPDGLAAWLLDALVTPDASLEQLAYAWYALRPSVTTTNARSGR